MSSILNTDFGCPLHKKTKAFMLDARNYELGNSEKDLKTLYEEICIIKNELFQMPFDILSKRKDLLFYIHNSRVRTTQNDLWKEIDICYRVLKSATDFHKKGVFDRVDRNRG